MAAQIIVQRKLLIGCWAGSWAMAGGQPAGALKLVLGGPLGPVHHCSSGGSASRPTSQPASGGHLPRPPEVAAPSHRQYLGQVLCTRANHVALVPCCPCWGSVSMLHSKVSLPFLWFYYSNKHLLKLSLDIRLSHTEDAFSPESLGT